MLYEVITIGQVSLASSRKQLLQAVMEAQNFDDVVARLLDIYPQLDMENLEEMVARSLLAAELFGRMNARNNFV